MITILNGGKLKNNVGAYFSKKFTFQCLISVATTLFNSSVYKLINI